MIMIGYRSEVSFITALLLADNPIQPNSASFSKIQSPPNSLTYKQMVIRMRKI